MRAARSLDIPLSFRASYCFSFLTLARLLGISRSFPRVAPRVFPCSGRPNARSALSMAQHDSWESIGWDIPPLGQDDLDRQELQQLARRLAEQRERQRAEDLSQLEELKRSLRERAADVARRELEVERRTRELEEQETPKRHRFRRGERQPAVDPD